MIRYNEDNNKQMKELKWNTNPIKQWTDNHIRAKGAIQISESLKSYTTLTKLDLSSDEIEWNEMKYNKIMYISNGINW